MEEQLRLVMADNAIKNTAKLPTKNVLTCNLCGKPVSTAYYPEETDTPDRGLIIRALIICPECIEKEIIFKKDISEEGEENHGKSNAARRDWNR